MATVKVNKGDTLTSIAKANNTSVDALVKANNIKNPNLIQAGATLNLGAIADPKSAVVDKPTATNPNPPVPPADPNTKNNAFIGSSDQTRKNENNLKNTVSGMIAGYKTPSSLQKASDDAVQAYQDYYDKLEQRRGTDKSTINTQFDELRTGAEGAQATETATTNMGLVRMGGYLGESGSGQGVMQNLAVKHRAEISSLEAKRAAAIQAAQNAIDDKQFTVVQSMVNEAKSLEKEINDRKNTFFNQTLQVTQDNRAEQKFQQEQTEEKLKNLSLVGIDNVSPEQLAEIDDFYKSPGFAAKYITAATAAANAENQKKVSEANKAYVEMLQAIPVGQSVRMPDGSTITGMGKSSDIEVFNKEDGSGRVTVVSFNKATGAMKTYSAGRIGTPSSTGSTGEFSGRITPVTQAMTALPKDPNTGFLQGTPQASAPSIYNTMYQTYTSQNPGKGEEFLKSFPVEQWLAPSDRRNFKN